MGGNVDFGGLLECGERKALRIRWLQGGSDFYITRFSSWLIGESGGLVAIVAPKFRFGFWIKLRRIMKVNWRGNRIALC